MDGPQGAYFRTRCLPGCRLRPDHWWWRHFEMTASFGVGRSTSNPSSPEDRVLTLPCPSPVTWVLPVDQFKTTYVISHAMKWWTNDHQQFPGSSCCFEVRLRSAPTPRGLAAPPHERAPRHRFAMARSRPRRRRSSDGLRPWRPSPLLSTIHRLDKLLPPPAP